MSNNDSRHINLTASHSASTPPPSPIANDPLFGEHANQHGLDSGADDNWSVPWSDLMMVMFVLFATLVAVQTMQKSEAQIVENELEQAREKDKIVKQDILAPQPSFEPLMRINVFEKSQQAVREAKLENVEIVLLKDQSVKVSVQGPMFFELGKANLRPDVRDFLNSLAGVISQTPYQVNVIGHTDDAPINTEQFPSNWELSASRASQVARYLITQGAINPARFTVMGRSKYQPASRNNNPESRSLNRRVEIIITREIVPTEEAT